MKISSLSLDLLKEIYAAAESSYSNTAMINPDAMAQNLNVKREYIYKCINYLLDREFIDTDPGYCEARNRVKQIRIKAKGIDLVEQEME